MNKNFNDQKGQPARNAELLQLNVRLEGSDVARFERFKAKENLRINAEAARKLILERLDQLEATAPAA